MQLLPIDTNPPALLVVTPAEQVRNERRDQITQSMHRAILERFAERREQELDNGK